LQIFQFLELAARRLAQRERDLLVSSLVGSGNLGTPLPAALPLFAGGVGLVGLFTRKKRKAALAA
jgi:hypothetical protein